MLPRTSFAFGSSPRYQKYSPAEAYAMYTHVRRGIRIRAVIFQYDHLLFFPMRECGVNNHWTRRTDLLDTDWGRRRLIMLSCLQKSSKVASKCTLPMARLCATATMNGYKYLPCAKHDSQRTGSSIAAAEPQRHAGASGIHYILPSERLLGNVGSG
jgi:hypothetical protein